MATIIISVKINDDGDCSKCEANHSGQCFAFKTSCLKAVPIVSSKRWQSLYNQCQTCKDFLELENSKVYCGDCKHITYDECSLGIEIDKDYLYSLNCKSKEPI